LGALDTDKCKRPGVAPACLRIETIWVSVNFDFFLEPPDRETLPEVFHFLGVYGSGKLTPLPGNSWASRTRGMPVAVKCVRPHGAVCIVSGGTCMIPFPYGMASSIGSREQSAESMA